MQIGEFLVKLGVVSDTEKVEKFSKSLAKVGAVATVAVTALNTVAVATFSFLDGQIRKTEELAQTKNGLMQITESEVALSKQYQKSTEKLTNTFDILRAKIALGVAPQMIKITDRMNKFLESNKKLITNGLQKVVSWLFNFMEGTISIMRSVNDLITSTIGWKNALLALVVVLALVKKATISAFLANPITWVVIAIAGLLLLIDDLMTYMRGGKSALGDFWKPFVGFIKDAKKWFNNLTDDGKHFFKVLGMGMLALAVIFLASPIMLVITGIATAVLLIIKNWNDLPGFFKRIWDNIVRFLSTAIKSILKYFGMTDKDAEKTVKSIGKSFKVIFSVISYPFKQAWKLIKGLFKVWTNDSDDTVTKIGKSFLVVTDLIKEPFKKAFDWVTEKFYGLVNSVKSGLSKLKFWEDGEEPDVMTIGSSLGSGVSGAMAGAMQNRQLGTINGGDMNVEIHVKDTDTAQVIKREIEHSGNKMAQYNATLAGGY